LGSARFSRFLKTKIWRGGSEVQYTTELSSWNGSNEHMSDTRPFLIDFLLQSIYMSWTSVLMSDRRLRGRKLAAGTSFISTTCVGCRTVQIRGASRSHFFAVVSHSIYLHHEISVVLPTRGDFLREKAMVRANLRNIEWRHQRSSDSHRVNRLWSSRILKSRGLYSNIFWSLLAMSDLQWFERDVRLRPRHWPIWDFEGLES